MAIASYGIGAVFIASVIFLRMNPLSFYRVVLAMVRLVLFHHARSALVIHAIMTV